MICKVPASLNCLLILAVGLGGLPCVRAMLCHASLLGLSFSARAEFEILLLTASHSSSTLFFIVCDWKSEKMLSQKGDLKQFLSLWSWEFTVWDGALE